ncbi:hypothetical protein BESB_034150 [Besnoitia besnoiti]|uniref:SRS domain-containing protein n=1 Tax=Besnoitia besnoiti TaxID=94643 RepID=A0A2A9MMG5_BESBE|nr:hypothetical protein BESB_034150 [Besnoitia besnoiti]PFH36957.1 hypothetical protein BESB_034150 [Besnoitia besnoiti]
MLPVGIRATSLAASTTCVIFVLLGSQGIYADQPLADRATDTPQVRVCGSENETDKESLDLVLEPNAEKISFKCGPGMTVLKPDAEKVFVKPDGEEEQNLDEACTGASLDREQEGVQTYTLTVKPKPPSGRILYFRCETPAGSGVTPVLKRRESEGEKKCTVKITVQGTKGQHGIFAPPGHICQPRAPEGDKVYIMELTLASDSKTLDFSCGRDKDLWMTPIATTNQFCIDTTCKTRKNLSAFWSDAEVTRVIVDEATSFTLRINSPRFEDKDLYYKCSLPAENKWMARADFRNQARMCILKIAVKGDHAPEEQDQEGAAPARWVASAWVPVPTALGLLYLGI